MWRTGEGPPPLAAEDAVWIRRHAWTDRMREADEQLTLV